MDLDLSVAEPDVTLGEPAEFTVTVANSGPRSASVPVEVRLTSPDGTDVGIVRVNLFVPFGEAVGHDFTVVTTRWVASTGTFRIHAEIDDRTDSTAGTTSIGAMIEVHPTERVIPRFEDVTLEAGVATTVPDARCGQFANGAAWGDIDGDGWQDLVVTRLGEPVEVFVNQTDGTFSEQSSDRGVAVTGANGASFADYDNDGDADLLLVGDGPNTLLANDGTGHFADVTASSNLAGEPDHRSMSAAWGDVDNDGFLDLYISNYMSCSGPWTTEQEIISNVDYHRDVLYRNDGNGRFVEVTDALPDSDRSAASFAAAWLDVDHDGRTDLYVANDFVGLSPDHNRLWLNRGADWRFVDVSLESNAGLYMNTMGIGIGDVDRDGDDDLALSNIGGNKLLRGGEVTFAEELAGIERPQQAIDRDSVTWGTVLADFDLDGWLDVFFAAGNLPQAPDAVVGDQPNMLFLNDGTGARFLDVSALTGIDTTGESKGVAAADYDGDGDVDLYVVDQGGRPRLYRNVTERTDRHWLAVDLVGSASNRDACGARVTVDAQSGAQYRTVLCGSGGTGSASERRLHFGLARDRVIESLTIEWPSGRRDVLGPHDADQVVRIVEADG